MATIDNKHTHVVTLGTLQLIPGINHVTDTQAAAIEGNKHFKQAIADGKLVIAGGGKAPAQQEPTYTDEQLLAMSDDEAQKLSTGLKGKRTKLLKAQSEG